MRIAENVYLLASGALGTGMTHPNDCNVYAVRCGHEFVLIDSGVGRETGCVLNNLAADAIDLGKVHSLFLTHAHLDHSGGARQLREALDLRVCASAECAKALEAGDEGAISLDVAKRAGIYPQDFEFSSCPVDRVLVDGERFQMGNYEVEVVATPGHSHDMLSYLFRSPRETMLFCGDTLFFGGKILLSNLYDCNVQDYVCSLRKLARQPFDGLFPGHHLWVVRGAAVHLKTAIDTLDRLLLPSNLI